MDSAKINSVCSALIRRTLLLLMLFCCSVVVYGGGSHYAELSVTSVSPTGAGTVYVSTGNNKNSATAITATGNVKSDDVESGESVIFYLWSVGYGYESASWSGTSSAETTNGSSSPSTVQLKASTSSGDTETYRYSVKFTPKTIELGTSVAGTPAMATWKNRKSTNTLTFSGIKYAKSVVFDEVTGKWTIDGYTKNNATADIPSFTLNTTYTIDPLTAIHGDNSIVVTGTATGFPDASGGQETKNIQGTAIANADLTPTFTVQESAHSFGEITPNTSVSYTFQQPATDFPNPHSQVAWDASVSGEGYEVVSVSQNGSVTIRFTPTEAGKEYPAMLTLTATWTDAAGTKISYQQDIQLSGKGLDNTLPGEIHILKEETEQTTVSYEWLTSEILKDTFAITTQAMGTLTAESNSPLVVPSLSSDQTKLYLDCTAPAAVGAETAVVTVRGNELNGEHREVTATLNIILRRWFDDIVLSATPDASWIALAWTRGGSNVSSYEVWRNGTKVATLSPEKLTYTDSELSPETAYTYLLKTISDKGKEYAQTIIVTTEKEGFPTNAKELSLSTVPAFETLTGIDATAAFLQDGTTTMDRLYLFSKKDTKKCYIYEKQNGDDKSYLWQHTVDPSTPAGRAGRITDSKVYIAGTCDSLFWNSGDCLGWMQPVNSDIYLDNVRLNAANVLDVETIFDDTYKFGQTYRGYAYSSRKASVFYLPEAANLGNNTSSIHLKGKNYLGGNMGGRLQVIEHVNASYFSYTINDAIYHITPNYSAPIAIKDSTLFMTADHAGELFDKSYSLPASSQRSRITCRIGSEWVDGSLQRDAYLDLSTRTSQNKSDAAGYANSVSKTQYQDNDTKKPIVSTTDVYSNVDGLRYEAPLVTGGEHGTFVIDGGQINLWPANGYTRDVWFKRYPVIYLGTRLTGILTLCAGKSTNYMACGNSAWVLTANEETFRNTTSGVQSMIKSADAEVFLFGVGDGFPQGHLVINGGTISAETDPLSYGYTSQKPNVGNNSVYTIDSQPLLGPDVEINGGTFLWPLYSAKNLTHGYGNDIYAGYDSDKKPYTMNPPAASLYKSDWKVGVLGWQENQFDIQNANFEQVYRFPTEMLVANTDYTDYHYSSSDLDNAPQDTTRFAVLANPSQSTEYKYGMNNVWSDADSRCWFYFPKDAEGNASGIVARNYLVQAGRKITDRVLRGGEWIVKPYNLTVEQGGEILVENDFKVWGQPAFCPEIKAENLYQALCLPFTAEEFFATDPADPHFLFYSYVEPADNANDAQRKQINANAYCYLYYLDDGNGNQTTHGVGDAFRANYHTHADGTTMQQGKTYILKFPSVQGDEGYWTRNRVTLRGAKGQMVNGTNAFVSKMVERPAADLDFVMDGNPTFAVQNGLLSGEYYVLDPALYGDDSFHAEAIASLQPMQGYVLGSDETMQIYRVLGRNTTAVGNVSGTGWQAYGAETSILVQTQKPCEIVVYTACGRLLGNWSLEASSLSRISATAGVYLVRNGADARKIVVY